MNRTLAAGQNVNLSREHPTLQALDVSVTWAAMGDPTISSALTPCLFACGSQGQVLDDRDVVFFNQPVSAEGTIALTSGSDTRTTFSISLPTVTTDRIILAAYVSEGIGARRSLGQLGRLFVTLNDGPTGQQIISTENLVLAVRTHGAAVLAEVYRRGQEWKFKSVPGGFTAGTPALMLAMGVRA